MAIDALLDRHVPRRGSYLDVDANDCIIRAASLSTLDCRWLAPIAAVIRACRAYFGIQLHSVYVSGSVASGEAVIEASDLDMYALLEASNPRGRQWAATTASDIERQYTIASRVELICLSRDSVVDDRELQQIFKLFAVCVHGRDIAAHLSPVVLGPSLAWRAATLVADLTDAIAHVMCTSGAARRQEICRWVMKRVVRAAFTLVAQRERRYTMALFPCYEGFCRFYPQYRELMGRVLYRATVPTSDIGEVVAILTNLLSWMPCEASHIFGPALEAVAAETFRRKVQREAVSFNTT